MKALSTALILVIIVFGMACGNSGGPNKSANDENQKTYKPSIQTSIQVLFDIADVENGSTYCMNVKVADFKNILSLQYSINWDPAVLKYIKVDNMGLPGLAESNFGATQADQGKLGISWYDASLKGVSHMDGTAIYQVCYEVIGESGSQTKMLVSEDPVSIEVSNVAERILGIPFGNTVIKVK